MWPLRNDFASILGGKNAPKSKLLQEVGFFFFRKVFKTLRLSAKINVFLVRKAEIIENRHQNRHKNSVIEKCAPEGDVFPIWQPFWIVLVRFWGLKSNNAQQVAAFESPEGLKRLSGTIFDEIGSILG